jgi:hypothetical protein
MDACNPIEDAPPQKGVLKFFTDLDESLMEQLQRRFKDANFVKAAHGYGFSGELPSVSSRFLDPANGASVCSGAAIARGRRFDM